MPDLLLSARAWPQGPLGFPMPDRAALALERILRSLPATDAHAYRHLITPRGPTELNPGERSDVSWISTESVDRLGEVILARGMDDGQFRLNPLVTLGHDYSLPAVGRSVWRRRVQDGEPPQGIVGIKAKTRYPPCPQGWPASQAWLPDQVFALVQAGLLPGKSIGFLPLEVHIPDEAEVARRGWTEDVRLVIDRWLLLEYACVSMPANPHTLVEAVSKGGGQLGFTSEAEIARIIQRRITALDLPSLLARNVRDAVERVIGRI
jgi:hypothetical protein